MNPAGFLFWRRPTLTRPIAVLPSGLQRFTSVFGMGTGGATALLSPEPRSAYAARLWWRRFAPRDVGSGGSPNRLGDWGQSLLPEISKELSALSLAADPLASTYRKKNVIREWLHRYNGRTFRFTIHVSTIHET